MGREIERILLERGHSVELVIDEANQEELTKENIAKVDVAFEFTTPETAAANVEKVLSAVPGVTAVVVDLEAKTAAVTCEGEVQDADLVAAVEKKGFKASMA